MKESLHTSLRVRAAYENLSLNALVLRLLEESMKNWKPPK